MARYRHDLPQLKDGIFLSDGGMETTLIFHEGVDLPHFASFVLLETETGRQHLQRYYEHYLRIARDNRVGFVLDSAGWPANPDWGARLGYDADALKAINVASIELLEGLRAKWETRIQLYTIVICALRAVCWVHTETSQAACIPALRLVNR